jgi:hypothetical protein
MWYKIGRPDMLPSGPLRFFLSTVTAHLIYAFVLFMYLIRTLYIERSLEVNLRA